MARYCLTLAPLVLRAPERVDLDSMLQFAVQIYAAGDVELRQRRIKQIEQPAFDTLVIHDCVSRPLTRHHHDLFQLREGVAHANDIAAFFVLATKPPYSGCAAHPAGQYGLVVTDEASRWTLAHEIGHVLGLRHSDSERSLMFRSTHKINGTPSLSSAELAVIYRSQLLQRRAS